MPLQIIISIICACIAAYFNAKMDKCSFHNVGCNFKNESKNKWKLDDEGKTILNTESPWYYFGYVPAKVEKFPFSSTILVAFTDHWHRNKSLFLSFSALSTIAVADFETWYYYVLFFIALRIAFGLVFTLFFDYLIK